MKACSKDIGKEYRIRSVKSTFFAGLHHRRLIAVMSGVSVGDGEGVHLKNDSYSNRSSWKKKWPLRYMVVVLRVSSFLPYWFRLALFENYPRIWRVLFLLEGLRRCINNSCLGQNRI